MSSEWRDIPTKPDIGSYIGIRQFQLRKIKIWDDWYSWHSIFGPNMPSKAIFL